MKLSTSAVFDVPEIFAKIEECKSSSFLFCKLLNRDLNFSAATFWPPTARFSSIDNSTESFLIMSSSFLIEDTSTITDEVVGEVDRKYLLGVFVRVRRDGVFGIAFGVVGKLGPNPIFCRLKKSLI